MGKDGSGAEASKDRKKKKKSWFKKKFWKSDSPAEKSKGTAEKSKGSSIFNVEEETTFSIDEKQSFVDKIATTDLTASAEENVTTEVLLFIPDHFKQPQDKSQPSKTECEYSAQLNDDKTEMSESGDFEPGKAARNRISTKITGKQQTCRQAAKSDRFNRESITRHSLQLKQLQSTGGGLVKERKRLLALIKRRTSPATRTKRNHRQKKNNQKEDIEDSSEEYVTTDDKTGSEDYSRGVNESDERMDTSGKRMPPEGACVKPDTTQTTIKHNKTFSEEGYVKKDNEANDSHCSAVKILNHVTENKEELPDERKCGSFVEDRKRLLSGCKRNPSRGTLYKQQRNDKTRSAGNLLEQRSGAFDADIKTFSDNKRCSSRETLLKHDSAQIPTASARNHSEDTCLPSNHETRCKDSPEEERQSDESRKFKEMQNVIQRKDELPNQRQLDDLCSNYGRKSERVLDICSKISLDIKNKDTKHIVHVWPVYQSDNKDKIAFVVVVTDRNVRLENIPYSLKIRVVNDYSQEGKEVMHYNSKNQNHLSQGDTNRIRSSISRHAVDLMKNHKYLSIISGSSVRSTGYGTLKSNIVQEACIVLYVHTKGYIPLEEEPFESHYDGVPVDVREGEFELYGKFATDFHESLPLSCQIGSSSDPASQERFRGALGCFIDHPEYNLCALTCAHVLLFPAIMEELKSNGTLSWPSFQSHGQVYQPHDSEHYVGRIVQAVYDEGGENRCGYEVAIFQVEKRQPTSGKFPSMRNTGSELEIRFDSGKSYGFSRIGDNKAIKIGPVSDLRTGYFHLENHHTAVRTMPKEFRHGHVQIKLCHQIEVIPTDQNSNGEIIPFAEEGDSGALVFINENENDLVCVGIVEGGTQHGSTIVTPIKPILNGLNVNNIKSFENEYVMKRIENISSKLEDLDKNLGNFQNQFADFANKVLKRLGEN